MSPDHDQPARQSQSRRSGAIDQVLDSLRGKIRQYVLVHGLVLAAVWVSVSFWFIFAVDYLPVLFGFSELSRATRLTLLTIVVLVFGFILYRWVFQRMTRSLKRESLALLLERRFPELKDALATVIHTRPLAANQELAGLTESEVVVAQQDHQQLVDEARSRAEAILKRTSLSAVFNFRPLLIWSVAALVLTGSVAWFAATRYESFSIAFRRLYMLDENQWPRDCHVQLVGVKVRHELPVDEIDEMNATIPFDDKVAFVGKGSRLVLLVKAEMPANDRKNRRLPRLCEFTYRTASGKTGRLPMSKVGGARDGFQSYALDQEVLDGIVEDLTFHVRGDDHRIGPFQIRAVPAPILVRRIVDCVFPDYLVDEASSRYTPRQVDITSGIRLPVGTLARVQVDSDRPLRRIYVLNSDNQVVGKVDGDGNDRFQVADYRVAEPVEYGLVIQESNGVFSDSIHRIRIGAETDKPPQITSRLKGIGVAVTPEARIPVVADIRDKHGLQRTWLELQTPLTDTLTLDQQPEGETLECEIDLRQLRIGGKIPSDLPAESNSEIVVTVVAKDEFDLDGDENIGVGSAHPLEIVTADRLLRILEREEADQRFRLEQIFREMTDARNYIDRARSARAQFGAGFEPGDEAVQPTPDSLAEDRDLRHLFLQRAILQNQKSIQEVAGVAFTFEHIRMQLINNRIDAEDRKLRLKNEVATPLRLISSEAMPALEQLLVEADAVFRQMTESADVTQEATTTLDHAVDELVLQSLAAIDEVLENLQRVLDSLLKFETQNELLDLVRNMLDEQKALQERTEALRNREAFDDIFNK